LSSSLIEDLLPKEPNRVSGEDNGSDAYTLNMFLAVRKQMSRLIVPKILTLICHFHILSLDDNTGHMQGEN
jgi:hypothetical protein